MRCFIHERSTTNRGGNLGPYVVYGPYLRRQLRRKGLRHPWRLQEGLEVALQHLEDLRLDGDALPTDWIATRTLLDRAIYRTIRELRPCGGIVEDLDLLTVADDDGDRSSAQEWGRELIERVKRLPVAQRLIAKLKWADIFFPVDEDIDVAWESDEAEFLRRAHPGRTLDDLTAEFRERVRSTARRQRGKVPSAVIAWLVGRAGADAVDTAFREIKNQLSRAAPPGAAVVSKPGVSAGVGPLPIVVLSRLPGACSPLPVVCGNTDRRPAPWLASLLRDGVQDHRISARAAA